MTCTSVERKAYPAYRGNMLSLKHCLELPRAVGITEEAVEEGKPEYMDEKCNVSIDFALVGTSERLVKLSKTNVYPANSNCFIKFWVKAGYRMMFKFLSIEMDTCNDFLSVYGDSITAPDEIKASVCSQPPTVYTTSSRLGFLLFVSDAVGHAGGASVLVSMFKTKSGSCGDEHLDCDNSRCVPDDQICNSRDNCGNNHDEEEGCRWWLGLVIALSVMAVVGIGALIFFIIFLKKYSGRKKVQSQPVQHGWAPTHASSTSGNQHQVQQVAQSYPTKTGNTTQYWDMGRGQGLQSTLVSSTAYTETAPPPANYTEPASSLTSPPVPAMPSSTTGVVSTPQA
ncbi:uncharacterized protein [Haliotis asinina]|uniref:uncharacterized protein n=1 Tax=Haliotis asinina TaxID=109174 RepID=UPI0035319564